MSYNPDLVDGIISLWGKRNINGLQIAEKLWAFKNSVGDASLSELQGAFITRGYAPPDVSTLIKYIIVWEEWVIKRKMPIDLLIKLGVERLFFLRNVPIEESEQWLNKALQMRPKELMKAMHISPPRSSIKVDTGVKENLENVRVYVEKALHASLQEKIEITNSTMLEFMAEVFENMSPKLIGALWRTLHGEASPSDWELAARAMGQVAEEL